jgi:hypothetical protein
MNTPLKGSYFLAAGEDGLRSFSPDGKTWSHIATDREGVLLSQAGFAGGRCVAAGRYGGELRAYSTGDGVEWERTKFDVQPYSTRLDVVFTEQDRFVAVLNQDGASPGTVTSQDGRVWSTRQDFLPDWKVMRHDAHLRRIAQSKGRLVAIGDYGARLVRPTIDSTEWEAVPDAKARDTLIDVAFGNGVFVGGGLHGLRMRSDDGLTWTERTTCEEGEHINAMIFDGKQFVGIGQGATYISLDGKSWERIPNKNAPTMATLGNGIYVGVLWPGRMLTSADAIKWEPAHQFELHVLSLSYGRLGT